VQACESGQQAMDTLAHYMPQLILMDVMMPQMDGPATLKAIRTLPQAKDIPVIFMTAKVQPHEIERYLALGSIGIISKPFDAMLLPRNVQDLWDKHND
jgi:CheY-like chemotaxis protein